MEPERLVEVLNEQAIEAELVALIADCISASDGTPEHRALLDYKED